MNKTYKDNMILDLARFLAVSRLGATIDDIMDRYEISRRTAERMLEKVRLAFDCYVVRLNDERKKCWRVKSEILPHLMKFSIEDLTSLKSISDDYKSRGVQEYSSFLDGFIEKVKLSQTKDLLRIDNDLETLMELEGFAVRQYSTFKVNKELLSSVREALLSFKKIKVVYKKQDGESERILWPLGILRSTKIYLVALEEGKEQRPKNFLLSRVCKLEILDEYYDVPEWFNLQEYANNSFGIYQGEAIEVSLKFNKSVAEAVKSYHFHPTQVFEETKDGVIVRFKACGEDAICWEVFKWGTNVEILEPETLKETFKQKLKETAKIYK